MGYAVLLLAFVLAGSVSGQSTTTAPSAAPKSVEATETSSESADKFTFSSADAKQRPEEKTNLTKDDAQNDALIIFETILKGKKEIPKDEGIIVTTDEDDDDDDDDNDDDDDDNDVEDNDDDEDEIDVDISSDPPKLLGSNIQIRRQGDLYHGSQQRQEAYRPNQYPTPYDSTSDNSPLLHLTQGGYQRPYSRRGPIDIQRQRAGSSPQPSESAETPVEAQQAQPQVVPQVTYASAYQPQRDHGAMPMFYQPFESSGPFMSPNRGMSNGAPNGFFNAHQTSYPEFISSNVQSQFGNGFQDVSRNPNPFSQYQAPSNPNFLFHSTPQFVHAQTMADQRPVHNLFQTPSFPLYMSNAADSPRPDYSAYFRNPSPMNLPHFQGGNPYFFNTHLNGASFSNPNTNLQPDVPGSSRFTKYSIPGNQFTPPSPNQQDQRQQLHNSETNKKAAQDSDQISTSPDKEDPISVPFGTRIQQQNEFKGPRDVYIRYPMKEAGYATEENLPVQNTTGEKAKPFFPFLTAGRPYSEFSNPDPYRNTLNRLQQGYPNESIKTEDGNETKPAEESVRNAPFGQEPLPAFRRFPEEGPFYAPEGIPNPFVLPERRPFPTPQQAQQVPPTCARDTNASLCFKDPDYPRRELLYALNSDSFLMDRLVMSDQQMLDGIPLVGENASEVAESVDNYICKSDLKYGTPLRAKNIQGVWKVVVNIERAIGGGKFIQPVRLEVCRAVSKPCSLATDIRTRCVQKYSLQRLLSWSAEKGVHNDVYRLPVACSCQLTHPQILVD